MPCRICPGCEGPYPGPARSGVTLHKEDAVLADKRYYLSSDRSRVVEEDDPDAGVLLAAEGDDISNEDVARYGLGKKQAKEPEPLVVHSIAADPPKEEAPAEDDDGKDAEAKAVSGPPENKAQKAPAKKDDGK
jgi:hypothetical protein